MPSCYASVVIARKARGAERKIFSALLVPVSGLCLNPTAQKDKRGVLGASFRAEQFSEIVGYSNIPIVGYSNAAYFFRAFL